MAAEDPVDPFGANVAGVQALIPDATLVETLNVGQKAITKDQARQWLVELTGHALIRLSRYTQLGDETEPRRVALVAMARDILHNGAASYVEAARYPERAGKAEESYEGVLWRRYQQGLTSLEAQLDEWLDDDQSGHGDKNAGASGCFPRPTVLDGWTG